MSTKTLVLSALAGAAQAATNGHALAQVEAALNRQLDEPHGLINTLIQTRLDEAMPKQVLSQTRHKNITETPVNSVFAQLGDHDSSNAYCSYAHDRLKSNSVDFYATNAGTFEFKDTTFPEETAVRWDSHPSDSGDLTTQADSIKWTESLDIRYDEATNSLWGAESAITGHSTDIYQGSIGNCWFMHGASAVARVPGRIESVFYNTELSSNGIYALQIYVLGIPTTVIIDDSMPLSDSGDGIFAGRSEDGALWGMLLEKAFAKVNGTWESIIAGDPRHSINALTGAPATDHSHETTNASDIWDIIKAAENAGNMISGSTASVPGGNTERSANGITQDHVYTILGCVEVEGEKLIRIRNPWGREYYQGPWYDQSNLWTDSIKGQVDYVDENDGIFFIGYLAYHSEFEGTQISYDTTNLKQAYYLVEDDNTALRADSGASFCGSLANNCGSYRHEFKVTSSVEQTVILNTFAWPERSYPGDCTTDWSFSFEDRAHLVLYTAADGSEPEGDNTWYYWRDHAFMP